MKRQVVVKRTIGDQISTIGDQISQIEKERLRDCWRQRGPPPFRHISKEQASPIETKN